MGSQIWYVATLNSVFPPKDDLRASAGDLVYAKLLTTDVLIVNSNQTAQALMEKRGAKYSGRPFFTFLCELYVRSRLVYQHVTPPDTPHI